MAQSTWARDHMRKVGVNVRAETAAALAEVCKASGTTIHATIKAYIDACIRAGIVIDPASGAQAGSTGD